ncbi:deoxyribonuclease IV [Acetobacterium wieringae]|uniref:Probable endonuclease 4 n=1 Tax=Acetobacterium wieringae TaxID=52694 RepID=A0ABY6HFJ8_9FIRM|nr:deoxyribonuclease IV [Acetobacterium wieringae]URN83778.1 deoxyribonuclease IV [Acetobacterium wieringae]UYO62224.1 deoxyribonuclease IV [Acetobacterium wieringae]VUZ26049.1 putative endonuclease 4 [Acetobacterium wieringae]
MLIIGPHLSIAGGFTKAGQEAVKINANTFQFFTRNPRGGKAKALDPEDVAGLRQIMAAHQFGDLLAHAPYTLNMCSATPKTREFARMVFKEDLLRLEELPCELYNFHPGSHTGQGVEQGISWITQILNEEMWPEQKATVVLETMSGKGTEIGRSFEELKMIIDQVALKDKMGVCLDTCHVYSGGYDVVGNLEGVLEDFERIIGLNYLKCLHLNDSMMPFNSNKDRHQKIGLGTLGINAFKQIVIHPQLKDLPFFLETPQEVAQDYQKEIELLRSF